MKKALFLDLDHTLIHPKSGDTFPRDKDDWEFIPDVIDRLYRKVQGITGWPIIIVTNQGGVAAGFQTKEDVESRLLSIVTVLRNHTRAEVHTCVAYDYDYKRKPLPGMAYEVALRLQPDLKGSVMVGDMDSDKEFADNAGIGTFIWAKDYFAAPARAPKPFMGPLRLDHNPIG